ncbi:MAG: homing endonuclease associated repeat-containing protein [Anaerolineales bacterium]
MVNREPCYMPRPLPNKQEVLDAIRQVAKTLGHPPSRTEFKARSGMTEYQVLSHFRNWREAVRAAGLEPYSTGIRLDDNDLLQDWGDLVRKNRQIPTRDQYRREGKYSPGVFEKHFGPWSMVPVKFRKFARDKPEWVDVVALLPVVVPTRTQASRSRMASESLSETPTPVALSQQRHSRLEDRPTYGNPIDFRGLRHESVNEDGVVFLFGMVAKELGYMVEGVQGGFPDCEAKRQIDVGRWQRVRIEFEFESRNFRDHGHPTDGCDVIVCWRHNWPDCPPNLEVIELATVIKALAKSED